MEDKQQGEVEAQPQLQSNQPPPTSRICVKNLPKHIDEDRMKDHFSAKGEVTDVKVMRTSDGRSRCFGFIGYKTAQEAQAAVAYFNKTFMDAMCLVVEFAYRYGAPAERPERPWSKYTEGTSANRRLQVAASGANNVPLGETKLTAREAKKKAKEARAAGLAEAAADDPKLAEFLALMQPRSKQAIWSNDDVVNAVPSLQVAGITGAAAGAGGAVAGAELADAGGSDDEYEEMPGGSDTSGGSDSAGEEEEAGVKDAVVVNAAVSDMDYLRSRMKGNFDEDAAQEGGEMAAASDEEMSSDSDSSSSESDSDNSSGEEEEEQQQEGEGDGASPAADPIDAIFGDEAAANPGDSTAAGEPEDGPTSGAAAAQEQGRGAAVHRDDGAAEAPPAEVIAETGRLFVRNLPYTATEDDLRTAFEAHGEVEEAHLVLDKSTRRSKGFALVQFVRPEDALEAFRALDGCIFMGRLLHVLPGKRAPQPVAADAEDGEGADGQGGAPTSFKRQREAQLKASAGNRAAWNSLFMRADTVAEAVAQHYGVTKAALLDPSAPDMAVRLALGETQVIAETKAALAEAGVDVGKLEQAAAGKGGKGARSSSGEDVKRSDKILLVKNLPFSTDAADLEALFSGIGAVVQLVLPPTKTLALVEFEEAQHAKRAFQSLAYKRYQHVPLYFEWAPAGILSAPKQAPAPPAKAAPPAAGAGSSKPVEQPAKMTTALASAQADDDAVESTTIYVKNLAFATTDEALTAHFESAVAGAGGALRSAKVARRKGRDGTMLSAGFGFVECSSENAARGAIKALQASTLDGHNLVLQLSQSQAAGKAGKGSGAAPAAAQITKIVVRNVAFEATRKDILGLFTPFGAVRSCRLPRKFDGTHRGFAFVDFATRQEAQAAVEAVTGTHLYGRRLVIEWAEEEGGLDELRAKTAIKFRGDDAALGSSGAGLGAGEEDGDGEGAGEEEPVRKKRRRGRD